MDLHSFLKGKGVYLIDLWLISCEECDITEPLPPAVSNNYLLIKHLLYARRHATRCGGGSGEQHGLSLSAYKVYSQEEKTATDPRLRGVLSEGRVLPLLGASE